MMKINTFFLRVSASCNLDCDYCYVFKHRDMSWKTMPATMSDETVNKFAERLKEYTESNQINEVNIIFHGGEPLMCGEKNLISFADSITYTLGENAKVNYSMQTNGTLITESFLNECEKRNIGISLSIDGHKCVHDKHRKYKNGKGSHDDVVRGITLLKRHPSLFEGVIGVIDPDFTAEDVLRFFDDMSLENVDLLLPDSTHIDLPVGREQNPDLYKKWLLDAFDSWFYKHQTIHLRTFEHILTSLLGKSTDLDAFGLGNLDYLTIETDGTYHTSDILKVTYENASAIGFGVYDDTIEVALSNEKVKEYNKLLRIEALPDKCKECAYSQICGGGSLPHRFDNNSFNNPSVYCNELYSLINHATKVVRQAIEEEINHV